MENKKNRVAITHGDTNGIGYELIFKTFAEPEILELCTPIIYGSPKIAAYHRKALDIQANFSIINDASEAVDGRVNLLTCYDDDIKVELGTPTEESGYAAIKALDRAMTDFRDGAYDVLINCPVDNTNINVEGYKFHGISKYIETCLGDGQKSMSVYLNDTMRMVVATEGVSIKDVPESISKDSIKEKATKLFKSICRDFNVSSPRVAILSLNPGQLSKEENEILIPAIDELAEAGIQTFGPYSSETFFGNGYYGDFDGVIAMYYDQGIPAFKAISTDGIVKFDAGLKLVTVTPDCGTEFDIAGKGVADEAAFRNSIYTAIDIFRNRANYDDPMHNPLQKLYHEKHDDGDKIRFSIPKKRENR